MKAYGEWRCISTIPDLCTRWRWVVSFKLLPHYPRTHWIGGGVCPRAGLDAVEKRKISCPCRESNPGRPEHSPSLYAKELYRRETYSEGNHYQNLVILKMNARINVEIIDVYCSFAGYDTVHSCRRQYVPPEKLVHPEANKHYVSSKPWNLEPHKTDGENSVWVRCLWM
jgi:hypothetical protein